MIVNGIRVYSNVEIQDIYTGGRKATYAKCNELAEHGYVFVANNNVMFGLSQKWAPYRPIKIAQSNKSKVRFLWAIKPIQENCEEDYTVYNVVDWR